jgi:hypothetical protein
LEKKLSQSHNPTGVAFAATSEAPMSPDQTRHHPQFPLRMAKSLREAAKELALKDGISLNHLISLAVAEKISRVEHQAMSSPVNSVRKKDDRTPQHESPGKLT